MSQRSICRALSIVALLLGSGVVIGCAGIARPSDLRPASHPLLEGVAPRTRLLPLAHRARSTDVAEPERPTGDAPTPKAPTPAAVSARAAIVERLAALEGQRKIDGRTATDVRLLTAALDDVSGARSPGSTIASARRASRPVSVPAPGDLMFFHGAGGAAEVAIVRARRADGAVDALAVTRGAIRPIIVTPDHPHSRRRGGQIANTFLRARRPDDEDGAAYLAGQLFIDYRTLLD